jgi:ribonuclease-3
LCPILLRRSTACCAQLHMSWLATNLNHQEQCGMAPIPISQFQTLAGLSFVDKSLLIRALTHPSYLNENPEQGLEDNQRLEFLGDAVLDFISGEMLYHRFPEAPEGRLTRLRSALVRTETLADFAGKVHIDMALMLGHGEEDSGGRQRANNLCAAFEAVIGALYLDLGIEAVDRFVGPLFTNALDDIISLELYKDAKSRLQEWSQASLGLTPVYRTIESRGPDHAKEFTVAVFIGDKQYATGEGSSKQAAAQEAAKSALESIPDADNIE